MYATATDTITNIVRFEDHWTVTLSEHGPFTVDTELALWLELDYPERRAYAEPYVINTVTRELMGIRSEPHTRIVTATRTVI